MCHWLRLCLLRFFFLKFIENEFLSRVRKISDTRPKERHQDFCDTPSWRECFGHLWSAMKRMKRSHNLFSPRLGQPPSYDKRSERNALNYHPMIILLSFSNLYLTSGLVNMSAQLESVGTLIIPKLPLNTDHENGAILKKYLLFWV